MKRQSDKVVVAVQAGETALQLLSSGMVRITAPSISLDETASRAEVSADSAVSAARMVPEGSGATYSAGTCSIRSDMASGPTLDDMIVGRDARGRGILPKDMATATICLGTYLDTDGEPLVTVGNIVLGRFEDLLRAFEENAQSDLLRPSGKGSAERVTAFYGKVRGRDRSLGEWFNGGAQPEPTSVMGEAPPSAGVPIAALRLCVFEPAEGGLAGTSRLADRSKSLQVNLCGRCLVSIPGPDGRPLVLDIEVL